MLVIWAKATPAKVLKNLSLVLRTVSDVPVRVVNNYEVPAGTRLVLALGAEAVKHLQTNKILAKGRTTTSYRTTPHMLGDVPVLVSYSAEIGEIDHGYYTDLLTDVGLAIRYCQTGKWHPVYGAYRYVPDFAELCAKIEAEHAITQEPVDVAMDLETLGLDPYAPPTLSPSSLGAYIVTIQASCKPGTADVVRFADRMHESQRLQDPVFRQQIEFLLNCPYVRLKGANFKFDLHWLWVRGGFTCSTFTFDTTIVGSLLDENRSNSLDTHTKIYVSSLAGYADAFNKAVDKSRMDKVPPDQLLPYAGGDVDADLQVAAAMKQELLRDSKLTSFYVNILHPAARAFEWVEQGGVVVDLPAFQELKSDLEKEHARLVKEACKIMGGRLVVKHGYTSMVQGRPEAMNLTKASMLTDFMFSPMGLNLKPKMYTAKLDKDGIQRPSTAMEHLEMFADVPEAKAFIDIIRQDSGVMKTYNCLIGETEVLTSNGYRRVDSIVQGEVVKTHTGEWKPVIGVYSNGKQPVFRVTLESGKQVTATENHPLLTQYGWVPVFDVKVGEQVFAHRLTEADRDAVRKSGGPEVWSAAGLAETRHYVAGCMDVPVSVRESYERQCREFEKREQQKLRVSARQGKSHTRAQQAGTANGDVSLMVEHEVSMLEPETPVLEGLWGTRDYSVQPVDALREFFERYGRDATWVLDRAGGCERELREGELRVVAESLAEQEQAEFQKERVVKIEALGERETFDLTIEDSHSFIANGIVVHNTYVIGFLEHLRSDGRLHPTYYLFVGNHEEGEGGAKTGRLSCKAPAFQTVPKHTFWAQRIRRCYPAPPGYVVVERDYSQGELRVIACIADETNMIAAYKAGRDLHIETAAPFAGYTYESLLKLAETDVHTFEETRQLGKAGNFGLVFGMYEDGFIAYARSNYGVELTREEAHTFREGFFARYPKLTAYHNRYKEFAKQHKQVRTPLGRIRHLPLIKSPNRDVASKAERQAINSPVQGTLTDMVLWTIALEQQSGLAAVAPCFGACHDSILNYVPEDRVDEIVTQQLNQMENLEFSKVGWTPQLRFVADAKVGPNWGTLQKFQRSL